MLEHYPLSKQHYMSFCLIFFCFCLVSTTCLLGYPAVYLLWVLRNILSGARDYVSSSGLVRLSDVNQAISIFGTESLFYQLSLFQFSTQNIWINFHLLSSSSAVEIAQQKRVPNVCSLVVNLWYSYIRCLSVDYVLRRMAARLRICLLDIIWRGSCHNFCGSVAKIISRAQTSECHCEAHT